MRARSADELSGSICATTIHVELPQSWAPSEQAHELHAHEQEAAALHLPQPSLQSEAGAWQGKRLAEQGKNGSPQWALAPPIYARAER